MLKQSPLLSRALLVVVLPVLVLAGTGYRYLNSTLPDEGADQHLAGLKDKVDIVRDEHGVPTIKATTDSDAFFALGYLHAQDRMWQLEVQRRMVQGRMSEVFGRASLNQDIWFRTLGLAESAKSAWTAISPEAQASLTAYAKGINAWMSHPDSVLPVEFSVLDVQPEPWTVYDSLSWIKVFALNLGGNFSREMGHMLASRKLSPRQLETLFPNYPDRAPTTVAANTTDNGQTLLGLLDFHKQMSDELKLGGKYVGSNAWVVAGQHSASGLPILANDPHLQIQAPSLWYVVDMKGDKLDAAGMSLVGLPMVIFGRNQHISWGGTSMMADVQDLYLEQVNPEDSGSYRVGDQWQKFTVREEQIHVKADTPAFLRDPLKPVTIQVRHSRHGPIISDLFKVFDQPVALHWTGLESGDTSYEAFFRLNYASGWQSFGDALSHHVAPTLNMLYADKSGNIGYRGMGKIPVRQKGQGTYPVPGWQGDYRWNGYIPAVEMPQSYNPLNGYIVNANNKVVGARYPYFISHQWAPPARAERITELLETKIQEKGPLTPQDMMAIQGDTVNLAAKDLLPILTAVNGKDDTAKAAIELLKQWQGDMSKDSAAATVFYAWLRHLKIHLLSDELQLGWGLQAKSGYLQGIISDVETDQIRKILSGTDNVWCDDVSTAGKESCEQVLQASLIDAIKETAKLLGSDPADWHWGEVHTTVYGHTPFSNIKFLDSMFERRIGNGGSSDSINVASARFDINDGYLQTFGPGFRQIMTWQAEGMRHDYMNSTGQSGNVMSRHYDDMVAPFNAVEFAQLRDGAAPSDSRHFQLLPKQ